MPTPRAANIFRGGNLLSGALVGLSVSALADEVLLHRMLHWRHMHNSSTMSVIIGGLFVAVGLFAAVAGLVFYLELRRNHQRRPRVWWGSAFLVAGVFQLWSSAIQYGVLPRGGHPHGLHLIGIVVLFVTGAVLMPYRALRRGRPPAVEREPVPTQRVR